MAMTITPHGQGSYRITQQLARPVVYLDHWAVRLFSEDIPLQNRFIAALHSSGGTWLFSMANLMEFIAMSDLEQAANAEALLCRAMPNVQVSDTITDKGYYLEEGAPSHPDAPEIDWLLRDLERRAEMTAGAWNTHRFVQDAIHHRDSLLPLFTAVKEDVAAAVMALTADAGRHTNAKKFTPHSGMTLREAFNGELLREPHLNAEYVFDENDAVDYIHASSAAFASDYMLLDSRWCHLVERAKRRLRKGGVKGHVAVTFSRRTVPDFLHTLEACSTAKGSLTPPQQQP